MRVDLEYDNKAGRIGLGMKVNFVLPFFGLQSVIDISITRIHCDMGLASTIQEQHVSIIKALTIINSQIPGNSINKTLQCLNSLRFFKYQHSSVDTESITRFIPTIIVDGLVRLKYCFEELHLHTGSNYSYDIFQVMSIYHPSCYKCSKA
jgi:hypothetical protein